MEGSSEDINSALESFREQWRAEVRAKQPSTAHGQGGSSSSKPGAARHGQSGPDHGAADALALYEEAPAPPAVEGMPPPPCPISTLPDEVLLHILLDVAADDVGDFVRLAQVCRRLAFLVATEERIWRRVCLGPEFGFAAMPRLWKTDLTWETTATTTMEGGVESDSDNQAEEGTQSSSCSALAWSLLSSTYGGSWQTMFRFRPRIRFNGCYISTVNYIRAGQASANMVTWNSPVHVCTYFRYLRFFRDGTCISLLTTTEPADVVPHLTKENLELHRAGPILSLPSSVMQHALKGRWRLGSSAGAGSYEIAAPSVAAAAAAGGGPPEDQPASSEGDLFVETEGVGKYTYRLDLALKTAGKGARNNKLVWKGFWSYNRLTDDWAEFGLKNDKAFIFSRVKRFA
ncbi:F-box protein [Magnaporthiopsis poae ATCC 64411]|uniref:F-box protein n=1 Tax=Magnaporthiopsis poae (strain ATCC 64411 / 73-15) TaxID=644358 RepID=A0A0C4E3X5_MAGP6|nr:F-box protein [Magnaporthiopsis poae ATCC 64411]